MKNIPYLIAMLCSCVLFSCKKDNTTSDSKETVILQGSITENMTLDGSQDYLLKGQVYVKNNATLTIPSGTTIAVEKNDNAAGKGALIVTRGSKLVVNGTADLPVVFTSAAASKSPGDWIGIIILGKAPTNLPNAHIMGLPQTADTEFGGDTPEDNSGSISYLRLEYCGGLNPDKEEEWEVDMASGLSLEGIGTGTKVENVMVKNSLDDGFQFVGGTVNAKYLIAYNNGDDDFDFDRGYRGKLQFLISYHRDPSNHSIRANGVESLNDVDASAVQPYTRPVISNMTIIGSASPAAGDISQGIYIRKNTRFNVRNSIIAGYSHGGLMLCPKTKPILVNNLGSEFKYNLVNADDPARSFTYDIGGQGMVINPDPQVATYATEMEASNIEKQSLNKNRIVDAVDGLKLKSVYSNSPDLSPQTGSLASSGADFSETDFSSFFTTVPFIGAVGTDNWAVASNWASWN